MSQTLVKNYLCDLEGSECTALVFTVLPARTNILKSMIQFECVYTYFLVTVLLCLFCAFQFSPMFRKTLSCFVK